MITVNIMSYKYGHLAAHCIESVINQSHKPDVIRFYDDGIGDCGHLPEIYPEVEFVLRPENLGVVANFNDALERTTTDRVLFLGADNWLDPTTIEKCLQRTEDMVSYDANKYHAGRIEYWHLSNFPHGSAMYNTQMAKDVGGYEASGGVHSEEDMVLFSRMKHAGGSLYIIEEPLLQYRWRHRMNFNKD